MAFKPGSELCQYFINIPEEGVAECKLCKQRLRNNRSFNLKLHVNKVHKKRSEIEKYFEIYVSENLAVCKTCGQRLQNRLGNLRLHMRRLHDIEIEVAEDQIEAVLKAAKRKMIEESGNDEKRRKRPLLIRMYRKTIIRSVIGLIVEDGVCPKLFSSKHFEAILRPMCEAISSNHGKEFKMDVGEIERILNLIANYIRKDFSNDLHSRLLSIKIDTDLNDLAKTFCISAQFIKEGVIKKRVLGVVDLKDNCQLNEDHIKEILYKFNIDSNQIVSASLDNTKAQYNKYVKNSEYLNEIKRFALYPNIFLGDIKVEPYIGYIGQLCLLDIFNNSNIYQPFLECRNLAKYISDEFNGYHGLFVSNNFSTPQMDSPWKAGSTCKMMNALHEARNLFQTVKFENPESLEDHFNCNEDLWLFIEAFCKSTIYLQKCILKCYSEELHIGDFYSQWLKCKLLTGKMLSANNKPNDLTCMMLTEILKNIEIRTKELLSHASLVSCLYLDPRFQRVLSSSQKVTAVEYLKKLWCRAKLYTEDDLAPNGKKTTELIQDDEDAFLNEFLSNNLQTNDKDSSDVFQKIELLKLTFQMVDTNVLAFWKDRKISDPEIQALSTICFAIPATEIYDKTRYSNVYQLNTNSELSVFTKENLLFIRVNAHLLDDAIAHLNIGDDESSTLLDTDEGGYETSEDENSNTTSTITTNPGVLASTSTLQIGGPSSSIVTSTI